jgi:hypothetical protein
MIIPVRYLVVTVIEVLIHVDGLATFQHDVLFMVTLL